MQDFYIKEAFFGENICTVERIIIPLSQKERFGA